MDNNRLLIYFRINWWLISFPIFCLLATLEISAQDTDHQNPEPGWVEASTGIVWVDNPQQNELQKQGNKNSSPNILIVGGGTHHDFDRWFNLEDSRTLAETGAFVRYTEQPDNIGAVLDELDILYLSNNQPLPDPDLRQSIFDFVESGGDLLLVHAAIWYNWDDWAAYNHKLVGGGSNSHPPYGEFEVRVVDSGHPVMNSVPTTFSVKDELYRFEKDQEGSDIHVLAKGIEPDTGNEYPVAWTVDYGEGRIVCITLGHDGEAHTHEAYKTILQNSIEWLNGN